MRNPIPVFCSISQRIARSSSFLMTWQNSLRGILNAAMESSRNWQAQWFHQVWTETLSLSRVRPQKLYKHLLDKELSKSNLHSCSLPFVKNTCSGIKLRICIFLETKREFSYLQVHFLTFFTFDQDTALLGESFPAIGYPSRVSRGCFSHRLWLNRIVFLVRIGWFALATSPTPT